MKLVDWEDAPRWQRILTIAGLPAALITAVAVGLYMREAGQGARDNLSATVTAIMATGFMVQTWRLSQRDAQLRQYRGESRKKTDGTT